LHLAGLPPKEISSTLNIGYQTVCNHLQTARTHLKIEILFNKKEVLQLLAKPPKI
jgi:DNA-directed RNA polymerase specialized sigma24 family protein